MAYITNNSRQAVSNRQTAKGLCEELRKTEMDRTEIKNQTNTNQNGIKNQTWKQKTASVLALFTSTGTLFCCALPAAIAAVAGGSAVVSLLSMFPWLVPLSHHKIWIFLAAALLILFSGILIYRPKGKVACSITGGQGCEVSGRFQKFMFWTSAVILAIGAFFAYLAVPLMKAVGI